MKKEEKKIKKAPKPKKEFDQSKVLKLVVLGLLVVEMLMIPVLYLSGITKPIPIVLFLVLPALAAWIIYYFIICSLKELEKRQENSQNKKQ